MPFAPFAYLSGSTAAVLPLELALTGFTAAILLVLLIILYLQSDSRRSLKAMEKSLRLNHEAGTAGLSQYQETRVLQHEPAVYRSGTLQARLESSPSFIADADELAVVFAAAIAAYEADTADNNLSGAVFESAGSSAESGASAAALWDSPSTAGFRVRPIRRVS